MDNSDRLAKLTLLLLYLTRWQEGRRGEEGAHKSWKGYDFDILDKLEEQGFISKSKTAKSVFFTAEGLKEGKKLDELVTL